MSLTGADCQTCGACCAYSSDWPRFTMESDDALTKIPLHLIAEDLSGMSCEGQRCLALDGQIGVATSCTIYDVRPHVCRECQPNDEECLTARWAYGLGRVSV